MREFTYQLEKYKGRKTRHRCPSCGHANEFTLYVHKETGLVLAPQVGKCNRENNCCYHYTPADYRRESGLIKQPQTYSMKAPLKPGNKIDFLPESYLYRTLAQYEQNNFFLFLRSIFTEAVAKHLCDKYLVGTSGRLWKGATIFWQKDRYGRLRQCKVMLYDPFTGKRVKKGAQVERYDPIS